MSAESSGCRRCLICAILSTLIWTNVTTVAGSFGAVYVMGCLCCSPSESYDFSFLGVHMCVCVLFAPILFRRGTVHFPSSSCSSFYWCWAGEAEKYQPFSSNFISKVPNLWQGFCWAITLLVLQPNSVHRSLMPEGYVSRLKRMSSPSALVHVVLQGTVKFLGNIGAVSPPYLVLSESVPQEELLVSKRDEIRRSWDFLRQSKKTVWARKFTSCLEQNKVLIAWGISVMLQYEQA